MKLDVIQDMTNNPNKYFAPLKMACETKTTQLVDAALDCLQVRINVYTNFMLIFWIFSRNS